MTILTAPASAVRPLSQALIVTAIICVALNVSRLEAQTQTSLPLQNQSNVLPEAPGKSAPNFSVSLSDVPLSKLIAVVYGELLRQPYIVDDSIKGSLVTFSFKQAQSSGIQEVLDAYLASKKIVRHTVATVNMFVQMSDFQNTPTQSQNHTPVQTQIVKPSTRPSVPTQHPDATLKPIDTNDNSQKLTPPTLGEPQSRTPDFRNVTDALVNKKSEQRDPLSLALVHFKNRTSADMAKILPSILGDGSAVQVVSEDTLLLRALPDRIALAKHLSSQFDTPSQEVIAKVVVVEYGTSDDDGAGFFGALKTLGGKLSLQIGDKPTFSNLVQFQSATLEAVISAISQDSKFHILESSSLRISSGKAGRLVVGQEVPILSKTEPDAKGNALPSISYRSSGLILDLKPTILGDRVSSDLTQELSSFVQTRTSNIDSPTLNKRTVQTSFSAQFGETVLLGGLDETKDSNAQSGLFGFRFTSTKSSTRSTLFLVISFSKV
jgi:general secretion pathway protein D